MKQLHAVSYYGKVIVAYKKGRLWWDWFSNLILPDQKAVKVIPFDPKLHM
jgi:hypothetical protein